MKKAALVMVITGALVLLEAGSVRAQSPEPVPETKQAGDLPSQIPGGVLNGKAISLPKPQYPAAARAVGASGAVTVQVLIDEEGTVASATAVSGHPLLRGAAVNAARGAKFLPTSLMGNPVKVSGVITYNFALDLTPMSLGYDLAFAQKSGSFRDYTSPRSIAYQLPDDWIAEKRALDELEFVPETDAPPIEPKREVNATSEPQRSASAATAAAPGYVGPSVPPRDGNRYTVIGNRNFSASNSPANYRSSRLTPAAIDSLTRIQADIGLRYRDNDKMNWAYRTGQTLGALAAGVKDEVAFSAVLGELQQLVASAPANVSEDGNKRLRYFAEKAASADTREKRKALIEEALMIRNMRF